MTQNPSSRSETITIGSVATVSRNALLCNGHYTLDLLVRDFPRSAPGQFVQVLCAPSYAPPAANVAIDWVDGAFPRISNIEFRGRTAFIRRPFSIADRWTDDGRLDHVAIIHHEIGPGTHWLAGLKPGDAIDVSGPLGRGFALPEAPATCLLVGGGVGIPPLMYLARELAKRPDLSCIAFLGARSRDVLPLQVISEPSTSVDAPAPCVMLADRVDVPSILTTDDGSIGVAGRVTDAVRSWLSRNSRSRNVVVFACGPEPMMRAVAHITREFGFECQLCIERLMGCGLGTCLSCAVKVRDIGRPDGWKFALTCQDGPVFDYNTLLGV